MKKDSTFSKNKLILISVFSSIALVTALSLTTWYLTKNIKADIKVFNVSTDGKSQYNDTKTITFDLDKQINLQKEDIVFSKQSIQTRTLVQLGIKKWEIKIEGERENNEEVSFQIARKGITSTKNKITLYKEEIVGKQDCSNWSGFIKGSLVFAKDTKPDGSSFVNIVGRNGDFIADNLIIPKFIEWEGQALPLCSINDNIFSSTSISGELTLGDNIEKVGNSAFYRNNKLSGKIKISQKLSEIGDYAFSQCNLVGVEIDEQNPKYGFASNLGGECYVVVEKNEEGKFIKDFARMDIVVD
ncbi:MAG: leucine-rich repeat domain-containing protein [Mycoplasmataceae bacterium]|nr:leucine-rich repeat domain-containing protein [Mycoplasmataceae bacterium]